MKIMRKTPAHVTLLDQSERREGLAAVLFSCRIHDRDQAIRRMNGGHFLLNVFFS